MTEESNEKMKKPEEMKKGWIVPTFTTLVGVAVSILVAWYQITLSEEQTLLAEVERSKAVKNELILIVEEHIINQKSLDVSRLARLSELRAKQEHLLLTPTVSEIVESAEFNILKSQYLEFEKKEQFKTIFNTLYDELSISSAVSYSGLYENSVNDLYASIKKGNGNEVSSKLNKLLNDFNTKIDELNAAQTIREKSSFEDIFKVILEKPSILLMAISFYGMALYAYTIFRRRKRRFVEYELDNEYINREEFMRRHMRDVDNKP